MTQPEPESPPAQPATNSTAITNTNTNSAVDATMAASVDASVDTGVAAAKRPAAAATTTVADPLSKKRKLEPSSEDVVMDDISANSADDGERTESDSDERGASATSETFPRVSAERAAFHASLAAGDEVDVFCIRSNAWLAAKVENRSDLPAKRFRVHFMGWSKSSDEDIDAASLFRLAPRGAHAVGVWQQIDVKQEKLRIAREKKLQERIARYTNALAAATAAAAPSGSATPSGPSALVTAEEAAAALASSTFVEAGATRSGRRITKRIVTEGATTARKPPTKAAPPKKSAEELARETQEDNLCGICGEYEDDALTDMVLCDGGCLNSYHFSCIGIDEIPDEDAWLCEQCRTNEQQCFACGRNGTIGEKGGVFRCSIASCGKFYHQGCVDADEHFTRLGKAKVTSKETQTDGDKKDEEPADHDRSFRCPRHVCAVCENTKKAELMQCLKCPEAYHPHCVPPSARYNNLGLLCYRHPTDRLPRIPAHYMLDRSFDSVVVDLNLRLPTLFLPKDEPREVDIDDCHHFRLQLDLMDDVKKEPPTYRKLVRNIYTFKQVKESMEDVPECVCKKACGDECINRLSFTECFGPAPSDGLVPLKASERREKEANCRLGEQCGNRALHQRTYPKFDKFHTVEKGWGLKVLEPVKAGQLVIEYVGEVINEDEKDRRLSEHARLNPEDKNMYIMELSKGVYIDARHKGSVSRFINHSCDPNCRLLKWNVRGVNRIAITAVKDIAAGEELSYDYQFHTSQALEWRCYCKSTNCRGTMAPQKLNLGGDQDVPGKKMTKKEMAKKMKRVMAQEKINLKKDEKETARRLSRTAPIARTIARTGPVPRELKWGKATHVFLLRNAVKGFDFLTRRQQMYTRINAVIAQRPARPNVKAEDSASTVSTEKATVLVESSPSAGVRLKVVSPPPPSPSKPSSVKDEASTAAQVDA